MKVYNIEGACLGEFTIQPDADLSGAYLRRACLSDADLTGVNLSGAHLSGARLNWQSHDLIAEILRQAAGDDMDRRALARLVVMSRDKCWDYWHMIDHPEKQWALDVLSQWEGRPER